MKRMLLTLATGFVSCSLFGQGAIVFATYGEGADARVIECWWGGQGLEGTNQLAQLYYGPEGAAEIAMVPVLHAPGGAVGAPVSFATGALAGYIVSGIGGAGVRYTDPLVVAPGASTDFQIRVWDASLGRTWEEALANLVSTVRVLGKSFIFTARTTTNAADSPNPLTGLLTFCADLFIDEKPDTNAPVVNIDSPTSGQDFLTTDITVDGTAYDPSNYVWTGVSLVEVRVNGGEWQTATGRESWNLPVRLEFGTNLIEARCRDGFAVHPLMPTNYSAIESVTVTMSNHPPNPPTNLSPPSSGTNQAVALTLQADGFNDPDAGDTHAASQWRVRRVSDGVTVFDSGEDAANKTSRALSAGVLDFGTAYDWQVRFKDNRGAWSDYSAATFSTLPPSLRATVQGSTLFVAWPTNTVGFGLEYSTNLPGTNWVPASPAPVFVDGQMVVTNAPTKDARFYRLRKD